jgi:hypothetical protein
VNPDRDLRRRGPGIPSRSKLIGSHGQALAGTVANPDGSNIETSGRVFDLRVAGVDGRIRPDIRTCVATFELARFKWGNRWKI